MLKPESGVNAAVTFDSRAKLHEVELFEREIGISNWLVNMDVI